MEENETNDSLSTFGAAAAIGLTGLLVYGVRRATSVNAHCDVCRKGLRPALFNGVSCSRCSTKLCRDHAKPNAFRDRLPGRSWSRTDWLCSACESDAVALVKASRKVEVYSDRYRGKVQYDASRATEQLTTEWTENRDDAETHLRLMAAAQGYNVVFGQTFEPEQRQDGNYRFRVWRAIGTGACC
ncbi:UNVERIFIED_ORG: hypothetical protein J2Y81_001945 [Paraburkholderia sediminicola]|nr:hypothetical protein [Paraburkholderia sediminicola]